MSCIFVAFGNLDAIVSVEFVGDNNIDVLVKATQLTNCTEGNVHELNAHGEVQSKALG